MTREEEYEFYAKPDSREPQVLRGGGSARTCPKWCRCAFSPETLERVRRLAEVDDRSVSSWIRRAVQNELDQQAG